MTHHFGLLAGAQAHDPLPKRSGYPWDNYLARFQSGTWRAPVFRDMVMADIEAAGPAPTVLDIGCGRGFDDAPSLQAEIATASHHFIGVEPDPEVEPPTVCHAFHGCPLEDADIAPGTVDVAYCVFVIEHLETPAAFFNAVERVLKPGGVFWVFTVDARSHFAKLSHAMGKAAIKDRYLDIMFGKRQERHRNYPTYYAANTPDAISRAASQFSFIDVHSLHHVGIVDAVVPKPARPLWHVIDRATLKKGWPGANLVARLVK